MNSPRKPSVLFVFYTHTQQSLRVAEAMAGVLRERGCDVSLAGVEFTDPRYAGSSAGSLSGMRSSTFSRCCRPRCAVRPGRSASLMRRGKVTTTLFVSARRHGSSPPTCPCVRI